MGPSQAMSMIASRQIHNRLQQIYNTPKKLKDAVTVLELMFRAHIWEDIMLENMMNLFQFPVRIIGLGFVIDRGRTRARTKLKELTVSNPEYWEPIIEQVKDVVIRHGHVETPFGPRQVTRIVEW